MGYNGIDISSYQNNVDFNLVKNENTIVYMKATEGATWKDPNFITYYNQAKSVGLKIGVYHFLRNNNMTAEIGNLLNVINGLHLDCKIAIDCEVTLGQSKEQITNNIRQFNDLMKAKGYECVLYTYSSFLQDNINYSQLIDIPVWIANYSSNNPKVTNQVGWQYTEKGTCPGISTQCDKNIFEDGIFIGNTTTISLIEKSKNFVGTRCLELQEKLNKVGYELTIDGIFGTNTYNALIDFQKKYNLVIDGLAGDEVFAKLNEILSITLVSKSKYDESIPTGSSIFNIPNIKGYIEQATDGRLIIHLDRGNYIAIGKGFIDGYINDNNGHVEHKRICG